MNTRNENGAFHRAWRAVDLVFEIFCLLCLLATLLIVLWQVFSRELLSNSPSWSEESARILLVWIGFLGATIGFREGAHIAVTFLVDRFPATLQSVIDRAVQVLLMFFGLFLIVQGSQFVADAMAATLPGTGLPRSVLYIMMPVAGAMLILYTVLQAFGINTQRYAESDEID
ncbi:TRAP transporter small permease [Nocardioides albus]|uniref:TRAP-type C4-dicarboxylate transport system permease small subunit n=1 Tax=Nocardioides albus TaxID=1841 RepID=A0A7W5A2B3_9ACTN|nr:TRAP transporter small permease [Nocardioides albus]MBB3088382.1 TRAP-type C4-dicarboxylate transport system permease small subunit [Nocardioides albus]GGU15906.1 C4-dicarboxylate ABC transporter permease [Nocardioides albus]